VRGELMQLGLAQEPEQRFNDYIKKSEAKVGDGALLDLSVCMLRLCTRCTVPRRAFSFSIVNLLILFTPPPHTHTHTPPPPHTHTRTHTHTHTLDGVTAGQKLSLGCHSRACR
jgi:hypothetical protein